LDMVLYVLRAKSCSESVTLTMPRLSLKSDGPGLGRRNCLCLAQAIDAVWASGPQNHVRRPPL
jgi:hypothetical protein